MIREHFGLTQNPFDRRELDLLPAQQEVVDVLKVHCQQGGPCLVLGVPGTGKSVVKMSLQQLPDKQYVVATVARTLHTYTNTVKILCDAFRVQYMHSAFQCERKLIEEAFSLKLAGKCLTTILDDAHLMDLATLRKLRLLFEDFPKNHNLVPIGRPTLLADLDLAINRDIESRGHLLGHRPATRTRGDEGLPAPRTRPCRARPQHLHLRRHRPDRPFGRRRFASGSQPRHRLPDRRGLQPDSDGRHRRSEPGPEATALAEGRRPRRIPSDSRMVPADRLRRIRNDLPMAEAIAALGRNGPPSKLRDGRFCFLCPHCGEMLVYVNPRTNLAHCFACDRNLNTIDLLRLLGYDFRTAVSLLDRWLTEYELRQPRRPPPE